MALLVDASSLHPRTIVFSATSCASSSSVAVNRSRTSAVVSSAVVAVDPRGEGFPLDPVHCSRSGSSDGQTPDSGASKSAVDHGPVRPPHPRFSSASNPRFEAFGVSEVSYLWLLRGRGLEPEGSSHGPDLNRGVAALQAAA